MILGAYAVPHPPIILPEIGRGEEERIASTRAAFQKMAREIAGLEPDTIVIASPHAPIFSDGFYLAGGDRARGDLSSFGVRGLEEEAALDQALARQLDQDLLDQGIHTSLGSGTFRSLDHGSLIPLRFIHESYRDFKLLLLGISHLPGQVHKRLGQVLSTTAQALDRRLVFVASGDLSHVLKKDGPYGYRPEGPVFDREIERIFSEGQLDDLFSFDPELLEGAAECGLRSFQIMAGALEGLDFKSALYSYEGTFGVGYAVASFLPWPKGD